MIRYFCKSKIHRATVTGADLNYVGSITLCTDLMKAVDILPYEKVQIVDVNNGARFETYAIPAPGGPTGEVCLNGAAARLVHEGDKIIIIAYCMVDEKEIGDFKPKVAFVDDDNRIVKLVDVEPGFKTHLEVISDAM